MWYALLQAGTPLGKAYDQLLATGVVGAIAVILGFVVYRLYKSKEEQRKSDNDTYEAMVKLKDEQFSQLVALKDTQEEKFRNEVQQLSREYHNELKELTEQLMALLKEKSASEARVTEVLQQVVTVQSDVERTLNRFLERFDGGSGRGFPRR